MQRLSVNIIYGNHGHAIHTEDTLEYVREGLESTGLSVRYSRGEYLTDGVNIVMECHHRGQNLYEQISTARQRYPQSRLYVIVTEMLTPDGFNSANMKMVESHESTTPYHDRAYWNERTKAFMGLVPVVDGLFLIGLEPIEGCLPLGYEKEVGLYFQLGKPVHLIPLCAPPQLSTVSGGERQYGEQDIDVLFTGSVTPYRRKILDTLRAKDMRVVTLEAHTAAYLRNNYVRRSKLSVGLKLSDETQILSLQRAYFHLVNRVPHLFERTPIRSPFDPFLNFADSGEAFVKACEAVLTGEQPCPTRYFSEFYRATSGKYQDTFERLRTMLEQEAGWQPTRQVSRSHAGGNGERHGHGVTERHAMSDCRKMYGRLEEEYYQYCREAKQPYFGKIMWASQGLPLRHAIMQEVVRLEAVRAGSNPLHVLEVGAWAGGSAITWAEAISKFHGGNGQVLCVDPWKPYFDMAKRPDTRLYREMADALSSDTIYDLFLHNIQASGHEQRVIPLRGQSTTVLQTLPHGHFDLAYIDGDHSYSAVLADLTAACELVKDGGILCGDDLELQLDEIDVAYAKTQIESDYIEDPRSRKHYHPGVTLAVGELFGRVSVAEGFWAIRRQGAQWVNVDFSPIHCTEKDIPRHLISNNPADDHAFREWLKRRRQPESVSSVPVSHQEVPSPRVTAHSAKGPKILLLQLEFPNWQQGRAWSYAASYGVADGLRANGAQCTTIPLIANSASHSDAWLAHARSLVAGQRFDQVWVWLVHTPFDQQVLDWISGLAPVRVGVVMESLVYDQTDYAWAPHLRERQGRVERELRSCTHALLLDECDAQRLIGRVPVEALWWPPMVPARFIKASTLPPTHDVGVFHGTPYGTRQQWLTHPILKEHLRFVQSGQPTTQFQRMYDQLQAVMLRRMSSALPVSPVQMAEYVETLHKIREGEFGEWIGRLPQWAAIVNLPSLAKGFGGRVFEGMAAGRPVVSYPIPNHPLNNALFVDGEEIVFYDAASTESLREALDRVLRDQSLATKLARNAENKLRAFHTSEYRLKQTLAWIESGQKPDYGVAVSQSPKQSRPIVASETGRGIQERSVEDKDADRFYVNLFVNAPEWSTPHPNADEAARWTKIASFLECILRRVRQKNPQKELRILDVGCGRGWLTKLASVYGVCEGVEPVAEVVAHARKMFPYLRFESGTADQVLSRADFAPYDVVLTSEVLEHVPHGQKDLFLAQLAALLTAEGYLILTTPRGEMWDQWMTIAPPNQPVEDWVTEEDLRQLFRRQGFTEIGLERVHVEVPGLRYVPAPTPAELGSRKLLPIYQVWACQRVGPVRPATFTRRPKVSVIVPTYNRPDRLKVALQSILRQTFQDFEIMVVNDGGLDVASTVATLNDGRIVYIQHDRNRGLAAARNTGLAAATGMYIAYLDDDDRYLPDHLETLVSALDEGAHKVVYSDAWRVSERREQDRYIEVGRDVPYSYDFNPADLLVSNYFPVLCVMHHRACVEQVGRFDESLFAHEDWDLWIRMATISPFKHVKRTTAEFSWRTDGSSMTSATQETYWRTTEIIYHKYRPYAERMKGVRQAQEKRLEDLRRARSRRDYVCSIVMPVYNRMELTKDCLTALAGMNDQPEYELIIVDNGSTDGTADFLRQLSGDVQIIRNEENRGFAKACNQGAKVARGRYLVFLNNNTIPQTGWLEALVREVEQDRDIAVVGSKLLYGDGTIQHAGLVFPRTGGIPYHLYQHLPGDCQAVSGRREFQCVTAACMLVRRESFEEVGGFDEAYRNGFEDVDLCLRIREQGHRIVYQPRSVVIHLEEPTFRRKAHDEENTRLFLSRWEKHWWLVDEDLYYHADGYKMVGGEATANDAGHVRMIENIKDRAAWAHVAAAQSAAQKRDWGGIKRELSLAQDWPNDPSVLDWGAMVAEQLEEPVYRAQFLARHVGLVDDPVRRLELIRMLLEQKNLAGAEEHLRAILDASPDHAGGLLLKGILCMQHEQFGEAEAAFSAALCQGAERRKCLMGMGMAAMGRAYTQGAWERFLEVLADYPDDTEAIHWLLRAGTAQNRWHELAEHLHIYVTRNPGDLASRFAYASVLLRGEQIHAARREYDALSRVAPTYDGLEQLGRAISGREAVLALEPASS